MKCEICDGISEWVRDIDIPNVTQRLSHILRTEPPGAYISSQINIIFYTIFDTLAFNVAMDPDSIFFNDYTALIIRKSSPFKSILNKL